MKNTTKTLSYYMQSFFLNYLPLQKGVSANTLESYSNCFTLLLLFFNSRMNIKPEKLLLENFSKKNILNFLDWLESERKCKISTRNVRLGAIHSFVKFMQYKNPSHGEQWKQVLTIKSKKGKTTTLIYMTIEGIKELLKQPDTSTFQGRKDLALLSCMYGTGARVQEMCDLTPSMLHLSYPMTVRIFGKGSKERIVPIPNEVGNLLQSYMKESNLDVSRNNKYPLFPNRQGNKITRAGISYTLQKYLKELKKIHPELVPNNFTCHGLRHSFAMNLLQGGVNIVYIRDILGHCSVTTTEVYAKADSKLKRQALESTYEEIIPQSKAKWENNLALLEWLKNLS